MRIFALLLLFCLVSRGAGAQKSPDKNWEINLSYLYWTQTVFRGAPIWTRPSTFLAPGITLFRHIEFRGPHVSYEFFPERDSSWKVSLETFYFNDSRPWFRFGRRQRDFRNQRPPSFEALVKAEYRFGYRKLFRIGMKVSRDLIAHHGRHLELRLAVPLLPFTSLRYFLGIGDSSMNNYLYGRGHRKGLGHHRFAVQNVLPFLPLNGVLIHSLSYSSIHHHDNQRADFVRGDDRNIHYMMIASWRLY